MAKYSIQCPNVHCKEIIVVNPDDFDSQNQLVDIICPSCFRTAVATLNSNFLGRKKTLVKVATMSDQRDSQGLPEHLGWLICLRTNMSYPLRKGAQVIGRSDGSAGAEVLMETPDLTISAFHCEITCQVKEGNAFFTLRDCNSTNGTFLNGKALTLADTFYLKNSDLITMGDSKFLFVHYPHTFDDQDVPRALREYNNRRIL